MYRTEIHKWSNGSLKSGGGGGKTEQLEEPTLQAIADAALVSLGGLTKGNKSKVRTTSISVSPYPSRKNTTILTFSAQVNNAGHEVPISVLMKKYEGTSSLELQAYSTLFQDLQPDSANIYNIHKISQQSDNLYSLIPRPYLIRKPYIYLENLEHGGTFRPVRKLSGRKTSSAFNLDFTHCLMAVETLARFHASSYLLRNHMGTKGKGKLEMLQKYPFLNQQSSSQFSSGKSSQLAPVFEQAFELAIRVVQKENPSLAFKLQRKVINPEGIFEKVVKMLEDEKYDNDDFYVVCHGNFLAENLLYSYSNNSDEPVACRITNFNSIFFGPLASDLALFLFTSTTFEFRQEFEEKLLAFYCDAFQEQLVARFGRNTPMADEFEENIDEFHRKVERQYKKMMEFAFYNACVLLPLILYTSSTDATDNHNGVNSINNVATCSSLKDLIEEGTVHKKSYFSREKQDSAFEKFALDNVVLKERLTEILQQLTKFRVLL